MSFGLSKGFSVFNNPPAGPDEVLVGSDIRDMNRLGVSLAGGILQWVSEHEDVELYYKSLREVAGRGVGHYISQNMLGTMFFYTQAAFLESLVVYKYSANGHSLLFSHPKEREFVAMALEKYQAWYEAMTEYMKKYNSLLSGHSAMIVGFDFESTEKVDSTRMIKKLRADDAVPA